MIAFDAESETHPNVEGDTEVIPTGSFETYLNLDGTSDVTVPIDIGTVTLKRGADREAAPRHDEEGPVEGRAWVASEPHVALISYLITRDEVFSGELRSFMRTIDQLHELEVVNEMEEPVIYRQMTGTSEPDEGRQNEGAYVIRRSLLERKTKAELVSVAASNGFDISMRMTKTQMIPLVASIAEKV